MPVVAVSGTREELTKGDRLVMEVVLLSYTDFELHVGDCPTGVDPYVADRWGENRRQVFEATGPWPQAGPIRNGRMLRDADVLVAFPSPSSRGTLNAIEQAIRKGIETHVYPIGRE